MKSWWQIISSKERTEKIIHSIITIIINSKKKRKEEKKMKGRKEGRKEEEEEGRRKKKEEKWSSHPFPPGGVNSLRRWSRHRRRISTRVDVDGWMVHSGTRVIRPREGRYSWVWFRVGCSKSNHRVCRNPSTRAWGGWLRLRSECGDDTMDSIHASIRSCTHSLHSFVRPFMDCFFFRCFHHFRHLDHCFCFCIVVGIGIHR